MNALSLYRDLLRRGVTFEADGERLKVDAPAGELTEEERKALKTLKPLLLRVLTRKQAEKPVDDGRRFDARPSRYPGYKSLYDPVRDEWHDFPTKDCYPSIVALANNKRRKVGHDTG